MQESGFDWKILAAIFSPIVAAAAIITNYFLVRKQIYSTVLANERKEWVNTLRNDVASFVASIITVITAKAHYDTSDSDSNYIIFVNALSNAAMLSVKIQILLNPNAANQRNLDEQVERIVELVNKPQIDTDEISTILDTLAPLTQQIIELELHGIRQIR